MDLRSIDIVDANELIPATEVVRLLHMSECLVPRGTFGWWVSGEGFISKPKGYSRAAKYPRKAIGEAALVYSLRQVGESDGVGFRINTDGVRQTLAFVNGLIEDPQSVWDWQISTAFDLSDPQKPKLVPQKDAQNPNWRLEKSGNPQFAYSVHFGTPGIEDFMLRRGISSYFAALAGFDWNEPVRVRLVAKAPQVIYSPGEKDGEEKAHFDPESREPLRFVCVEREPDPLDLQNSPVTLCWSTVEPEIFMMALGQNPEKRRVVSFEPPGQEED